MVPDHFDYPLKYLPSFLTRRLVAMGSQEDGSGPQASTAAPAVAAPAATGAPAEAAAQPAQPEQYRIDSPGVAVATAIPDSPLGSPIVEVGAAPGLGAASSETRPPLLPGTPPTRAVEDFEGIMRQWQTMVQDYERKIEHLTKQL